MFFDKKNFIITISILTIVWLGSLVGWLLFYNKIEARSVEIAENSSKRAQLEERIQKALLLDRTVSDIAELDAKLNRYFLKEDDAVDFLDRIEKIALSAGVEMQPNNLSKNANNELEFSISASGQYSNLLQFSALVENIPYNIEANKVSIVLNSPADTATKQATWKMDIALTVHSFLAKVEPK